MVFRHNQISGIEAHREFVTCSAVTTIKHRKCASLASAGTSALKLKITLENSEQMFPCGYIVSSAWY